MTIIEALVKLRNDLKLWVANNLRVKLDKNLGENNKGKVLLVGTDGNIIVGNPTIEGAVDAAARLSTPRTISLDGDVTGSTTFDGSQNVTINATVAGLESKLNKKFNAEEKDKFLTVDEQGDIVTTKIEASITELGYMKGVTSNVQAQLNNKVTTTYVNEAVKDKLDKNLGAEEKDKFLTVDEQGDIVTTEIKTIINSEIDEIFEGAFYSITYNLLNCTSSSTEEEIYNNEKFITVITPDTGYKIENISITVGTEDVTQSVRNNNIITIPSVTGNIVITATAVPLETYTITYNLTNCSSSNTETTITEGSSYDSSISCDSSYMIADYNVTMEGGGTKNITQTSGRKITINIPEVTGNIIITAMAEN